jgi:Glycine-rich domain-containing protein-like
MVAQTQASSQSFAAFLQKARQLDLSPIAYQLMRSDVGCHWTKAKTVQVIARYLSFLYLANRYSHLQLAPSSEIDQVWHHHILDTSKYAADCQMLFGCVVHHFPYLGLRGEQDRQDQSKAYALMQALLKQHFGYTSLDQDFHPGDCEPICLDREEIESAHSLKFRSRLHTPIAIGEVLANISALQSN